MARSTWETLEALVSSYTPVRLLPAAEVLQTLHGFVNLDQGEYDASLLPRPYGVSWTVVRKELSFEPQHLRVGDRFAALYSCCLPPVASAANCLGELYSLPIDQTAVLEWRPMERVAAVKRIRSVQRHYQNLRWSWWAGIQQHEGTNLAIEDTSASTRVEQLGDARIELESEGIPYGDASFSVLVAGSSPEELHHTGARLSRIFAQMDGKLIRESYSQAAVYFDRWFGAARRPAHPSALPLVGRRRVAGSRVRAGPGAVDLASPERRSPARRVRDALRHPVLLRPVRRLRRGPQPWCSGRPVRASRSRSTSCCSRPCSTAPRVLVLDLGGSYQWLTRFLGGRYITLNPEQAADEHLTALRPFSLEPSVRTFHFLTAWLVRLMQLGGYDPQASDKADLTERIEDLYRLDRAERTLTNLVRSLPQPCWPSLSRFVGEGSWARWFDGPPGASQSLTFDTDWQVIDLAGATAHPDWCTAALFFLFERMRLQLEDDSELSRLKLMVVDEAWRFLADSAVLENLTEAAKTWRKRNAALVLATQSLVDLSAAGAEPLLESLPTRLFLANPDFPDTAVNLMGLTDAEAHTVRNLEPKREIFLQRAAERAVLHLSVDPESVLALHLGPGRVAAPPRDGRPVGPVARAGAPGGRAPGRGRAGRRRRGGPRFPGP